MLAQPTSMATPTAMPILIGDADSDTDSDTDVDTGSDSECEPGWAGEACEICVRFVNVYGPVDGDWLTWQTAGPRLLPALQLE